MVNIFWLGCVKHFKIPGKKYWFGEENLSISHFTIFQMEFYTNV